MPIVTVELVAGRTVEQKREAAKAITEAVVEHLKTSPASVTIVFREVSRENIATSGVLFSDR
jgi:4-oxalocrotonate tautomerase